MIADVVVVLHLAFIIFVMFGGTLVFFLPKVIWLHIPCVIWGIAIELTGWICPLTPLENLFRVQGGEVPYSGDFVIHSLESIIYPQGLTRELQIFFGVLVISVNVIVYGNLYLMRKRQG
jgi:Protein of Unknown function (DUF2784)